MSGSLALCVINDTFVTIIKGQAAITTFKISGIAVGPQFEMLRGEFRQGEYAIVYEEKICLIQRVTMVAYVFSVYDVVDLEALYGGQ
jgi:hypothetical protein